MKPYDTFHALTLKEFMVRHTVKNLALTMAFNCVIALFLYVIELFDAPFLPILIISQCIGLSICLFVGWAFHLLNPTDRIFQLLLLIGTIAAGTCFGLALGIRFTGHYFADSFSMAAYLSKTMVLGLVFGGAISYFFIVRERMAGIRLEAQNERLQRITLEKQATEAELRLLQAQIEPHFLFNTLSNIISLLETDPEKGKIMLLDLTRYLRATLDKSRRSSTTLGQEMELISAYLKLHAIRMGDRLSIRIRMPDDLKAITIPPMLIQPLVENAITHGLDPLMDGGTLSVTAGRSGEAVQIRVADTGPGVSQPPKGGVGLTNIRERLDALYGHKARLILENSPGEGFTAILEIPLETTA